MMLFYCVLSSYTCICPNSISFSSNQCANSLLTEYVEFIAEQGDITARYRDHIPAPKMAVPGHEESYNPPPEYLFDKDEVLLELDLNATNVCVDSCGVRVCV